MRLAQLLLNPILKWLWPPKRKAEIFFALPEGV